MQHWSEMDETFSQSRLTPIKKVIDSPFKKKDSIIDAFLGILKFFQINRNIGYKIPKRGLLTIKQAIS